MTARDDDLIRELNDELARRRAASTYVNSMWWAIHDALGGEWHAPDADHAARWVETWETLLAAQAVVAERDALRDTLGILRAIRAGWSDDGKFARQIDAALAAPEPCAHRLTPAADAVVAE